jgi:predicted RNA-binding protein
MYFSQKINIILICKVINMLILMKNVNRIKLFKILPRASFIKNEKKNQRKLFEKQIRNMNLQQKRLNF